jgi:conjugal transfer pilus assembly protein TraF
MGDTTQTDAYYEDKERGWFWKEPIPEPLDPLPVEEPPELVPLGQSTPVETEQEQEQFFPLHPEVPGPRPFSPAWLREKLPEYRDKALADPSPENVRTYYYVQRYSMDMAERFALQAQKVVLADPILDENSRRPLSDYGAQIFDKRALAATEQVAKKIAGMAGIWYFYHSECPYCEAQNPILLNLKRKLDLAILPIGLDGRPMAESQFANFAPNKGHAQELNVQATPTIYMVRPPNDFVLLSEGLVTENSLKQRMILGAHEAGWITDAELNSTKPVNHIQIQADLGELPEEVLNDPERLVEILRNKIVHAPR